MDNDTKICPFCGEEILQKAVKCRYCGEYLYKITKSHETYSLKMPVIILSMLLVGVSFLLYGIKYLGYQYNNTSSNSVVKADYIGDWEDLYSQRASLSIEDIGNNQLKVYIGWSNSAVSRTDWSFTCNNQNNSNILVCNNGKEVDTYVLCNGRRIDNAGEAEECSNSKEVEETVKQNMTATFSLIKGNLEQAMNDVDFLGDKNYVIQNSKDMTLYVKNITDNELLKQCVFYKYNY